MARMYFGKTLMSPHTVDEKEVAKTKFGASVDTFLGDVDENGVLKKTTWKGALNFSGVKEIDGAGLSYMFQGCPSITSVDLSSLQSIKTVGMMNTFRDCTSLTNVDLSSLQSIDNQGMSYALSSCRSLTNVDLSSLQSIAGYGMYSAFSDCTSLTNVDLSSLQSIDNQGMSYAFGSCTSLTSVDLSSLQSIDNQGMCSTFSRCTKLAVVSFPSLTNMQTNSFGLATYSYAFDYCTNITEIHFRADMQATIEACNGYATKWGATNATIYFDLVGTITVDGVAYTRDEKQSIRVDGVKTFVGWKDVDGNVVYTSYANNAEPVVGTVVYSDGGTTQVGTVEAVA